MPDTPLKDLLPLPLEQDWEGKPDAFADEVQRRIDEGVDAASAAATEATEDAAAAASAASAAQAAALAAQEAAEAAAEGVAVPAAFIGSEIERPGSPAEIAVAARIGDATQGFIAAPDSGVSVDLLPGLLDNTWRYNTAAYSQDNIVTLVDGTQYAVWLRSGDRHAMIGKRNVDTGTAWQTVDLRTITPDVFLLQDNDGHNTFVVGVSSDGKVHVAGNHHNDTLRYAVTGTAGNIATFAGGTMIGTQEASVTYPAFFNTTDGTLFFAYRDGASGAGNYILNRYNAGTGTWARVGTILEGTDSGDSGYPNKLVPDPTTPQGIHMFFTWRSSPTASSNRNVCYAYSPDGGVMWEKSTGAAQTVPITFANSEVVVAKSTGSGLMNQAGADADEDGHPHGAFTWYDAAGNSQYFHVWHDGTSWQTEQVTAFTQRIETIAVGTVDLTVARPQIFCVGSRTYMLGRCKDVAQNGVLLIDATPGSTHATAALIPGDLTEWEPAFDTRGLRQRGELRFLLTDLSDPGPAWDAEPAGIVTIPVDRLNWAIGAGTVYRTEDLRPAAAPPVVGRKPGVLGGTFDLNTLSTRSDAGTYHLLSSGTFTNVPTGMAYPAVLEVTWASQHVLVQTLRLGSQAGSFYRTLVTGAWSAWFPLGPRLVTPGNGSTLLTLPDGVYHLDNARTHPDEPSGRSGNAVLEISSPGTTAALVRVATLSYINGTGTWINYAVSGAWAGWVKLNATGTLAGGTNLATIPVGTHLLVSAPSSAYVGTPTGFAALGLAAALEVITISTGVRLLRLTTLDRTKQWEASYQSSTLSAWVQTRGT